LGKHTTVGEQQFAATRFDLRMTTIAATTLSFIRQAKGGLPMHSTVAAEAIGPYHRGFWKNPSGKYAQRPQTSEQRARRLHLISHAGEEKDDRGEHIHAVRDLTRDRLSGDALAQARSEPAHAARVTSFEEFTATIAHEVNQPLAAIITNGESGLRRLAQPDPDVDRVRELTKRMVADARRASEIIDRIRGMATRRPFRQSLLSLDEIIKESMDFLRHEFQSRGISIVLDLAPSLPRFLGDRTQIQQVIVNVAINAIQAIACAGGVRQRILVRALRSGPATLRCDIEDSGPGIDPALLHRLFDGLFTTKEAGMGIGLAISRSIIEAHAGHIAADNSSTLQGARFSFTLPIDNTD
jgi:signal transduction histidine kinase